MRKIFVLLAIAALVPGVTAVLVGCDSTTPTRETVEPANTEESTVAAVALTSDTADSPSTSPLGQNSDERLEFLSPNARSSSGKNDGIISTDQDPSQKGTSSAGSEQGRPYSWVDGDRTLTVYLQNDLAESPGANSGNVVRGASDSPRDGTLPVFRSESGELMTLPGGVLLVLDSEWNSAQVDSFFADNSIKRSDVSELDYADNGFFVETDPGFPSLELANTLAVLDGVVVSSPNWRRESVAK